MVKDKDLEKETSSAVEVLEKPENDATVVEKPVVVKEQEVSPTVVEEEQNAPTVVKEEPKIPTVVKEQDKNILEKKHNNGALNTISIFGILLAAFMIILVIAFLVFSFAMSSNTNMYSGVYIKNVDVSNLNKNDAKAKIDKYFQTSLPEEIILTHGDYEVALNTAELNINFDTNSAIDKAYNIGRDGNFVSNGFEILFTGLNNKNVEPTLNIDEDMLTNMLQDISTKLPDKVIDSGYYIEDNNLIISKGSDGVVINVDKTKNKIKESIKNLNLINNKIEISVLPASPTEPNIEEIYNKIHKDAVDASFTPDPISITPSENGMDFAISIEEAKAKLESEETECVIPLKVVYPNVTTNMIGTEAFPDKLSDFSTHYAASNVNRTTNLRLAADKINGTVVMPGEIFSYNNVVGERTIAAGYKEAPIYVSGRVEDGLGGGICQITTTLYNAVVYANLEIVERTNHQFVPSYVGAGRDATVVYGAIDFKFKNNRNYPIKIICSVSGGIANFQILGLRTAEDYDVEIYSRITSQTANYTNSETYKTLKQNGNVVDQTLLSKDTYKRH